MLKVRGARDMIARAARAKIFDHAHFCNNEAFVTGRQGVLGCRTSSKSSRFEAIYSRRFM